MTFDPILAEIRFGTGLSPRFPLPGQVDDLLIRLSSPDAAGSEMPIPPYSDVTPSSSELRKATADVRNAETEAAREEAVALRKILQDQARRIRHDGLTATLMRAVRSPDGMRERLTAFWADHFTVRARGGVTRHLVGPFVEEAIRPNLTGRFSDLLVAVTTHPMMGYYLDQHRSIGPNSRMGLNNGLGLNENLARELLELHTVGVKGPYSQADVRQLAELLTGLYWRPDRGLVFRTRAAEPGPEQVLGRSYGGEEESLDAIVDVLHDLALHPATARHLATKLVVHFVSDTPDPDLVDAVAAVYLQSGGRLLATYEALLQHPAAWAPERRKVKKPLDFMQSAMRALDVDPASVRDLGGRQMRAWFYEHLRRMGQEWERPLSPEGWPEEPEAWVTPQALAGRIDWSMQVPQHLVEPLPDPRDFLVAAFGPEPPEEVAFAARAAEGRREGIGLVLASAAFQRR
ncbi:DUF1800 domain-containing protein [Roseisalinus antarcticus]|uniref:DUF1800 domain-containing protein n=1 Tax=Roseisalinus antarcticus TaxID=254357 RepID=A0A1Y5TZQ6_9RHOB|nr:DUF1800 domain-containing protein [Roseisalinus antarcticus]SLN72367.1 hypothetical protein ROA7023_03594 [Roseisalinus antarcticus]